MAKLAKAGFEHIEIEPTRLYSLEDARAFLSGLTLLANTLATGVTLVALIFTFGPISGAHCYPAVTLMDASNDDLS